MKELYDVCRIVTIEVEQWQAEEIYLKELKKLVRGLRELNKTLSSVELKLQLLGLLRHVQEAYTALFDAPADRMCEPELDPDIQEAD